MRWKRKIEEKNHVGMITYIPEPSIGDKKEEIKFAIFPTKIDKENMVWLERYICVYEYKNTKYKFYINNKDYWIDVKVKYELCGGITRPYIWRDVKDWKLIDKKFYN